jgi:double-stranded uracil-DNA glycosylase
MTAGPLKASLAPVFDARARVLVVGSLPGEVSLARGQYYAHPQNQFWRLMERVLGAGTPAGYEARLAALQDAGVALWDVVRTARRKGSLDSGIQDAEPNPLAAFITQSLPQLRAVAFNGGKAAAIGRPQLAGPGALALIALPSSSPAHTLAFERKAAAWLVLRPYLDPPHPAAQTK